MKLLKNFGQTPAGPRLERVRASKNYRDGSFHYPVPTEVMAKKVSFVKMMGEFLRRPADTEPKNPIPFVKTDLHSLAEESLVWFGHSSYLIRTSGLNILVDPVMSGSISPIGLFGKAFPGANAYSVQDLPEIDFLVLTHDHFDHLDYATLRSVRPKVKRVLATLGVGSHLEFWGMPAEGITELDWWESFEVAGKIKLTSAPSRHFSGRTFKRNQTLWGSFVLESGSKKIYLGGDSGYGPHFKMIGEKHGPFDLALLECGQYGPNWPLIHMFPEETVIASQELGAKVLFPVHWGKFVLSTHAWNDPIRRAAKKAAEEKVRLATPRIGEVLRIGAEKPSEAWWE